MTVDLTGLRFADASLMLDLAMLARRLRHRGRALVLSSAPPNVWSLVEAVGIHKLPGVVLLGGAPAALSL